MLVVPQWSKATQQLAYLQRRIRLTKEEEVLLFNGRQGFKGEKAFANLLEANLSRNTSVLYDVLLKYQNTHFQMDALFIQAEKIYLFEIKHFYGDYLYQDQDFYKLKPKRKVKNPFHQLQRTEDSLRDFLQAHQLNCTIHSYVVFNHPAFTLYQAPISPNMILPTQQQRFIQTIQEHIPRLSYQTEKIQNLIQENHLIDNPFEYKPTYSFDQLKRGVLCLACGKNMKCKHQYKMCCISCSSNESIDSAVLRHIMEYSVLFNEKTIRTHTIYQLCGEQISMKTIRRVLNKYLKRYAETKASYYEFV